MAEPRIEIEGTLLTPAQSMTVRVALETFSVDISSGTLGSDDHGKEMGRLYGERIEEIRKLYMGCYKMEPDTEEPEEGIDCGCFEDGEYFDCNDGKIKREKP